jgi:acetyltransferase EpsM
VIAIGNNADRKKVAERFGRADWLTLVSRHARVHASAGIGPGSIVFDNAVVQADVTVGRHAIINVGAGIGHDSAVGDYAHVAAAAFLAGETHLGEGAFVCIGGNTAPRVRLGGWSTLGAGSTAMRDIPPHAVAIGAPARLGTAPGN